MLYTISRAEKLFRDAGTFFHLATKPLEDALLINDDNDYIVVNNIIAIVAFMFDCKILAFAIMSNHLHFILEGSREECLAFFNELKARLLRYYRRHGRGDIIKKIETEPIPILNLKQLRDEIVYVVRNPFVIRTDVNPLAYRWCSGQLYFNPFLDTSGKSASTLSVREKRIFTSSRIDVALDKRILIKNGIANPASFVDYKRAMDFFDNARQFMMWMFKNVEGQVEASRRHGERPNLNDEEILSIMFKLCRSEFAVNSPKELSIDDKKQLALRLKNDYYASNGQIARCVNMPLNIVNSMFPLVAKL